MSSLATIPNGGQTFILVEAPDGATMDLTIRPLPARRDPGSRVATLLGGSAREGRATHAAVEPLDARILFTQRIASVPVRLTFEEASALAGWVVYLEDATAEAVDRAVAASAGLAQHGLPPVRDARAHRARASRVRASARTSPLQHERAILGLPRTPADRGGTPGAR